MMTATAALRLALAATHGVVNRIHDHAAHVRATPLPASATCFPAVDIHVIDIPDLADSRVSAFVNPANFARWHFHQRVTAFTIIQGRLLTGAACNLSAAAGYQLDIVNVRA